MAVIPLWLTGPGGPLTVVITPQTVTAGTLADTTPVQTITADLDTNGINIETSPVLENIATMNRQFSNNVIIENSTRITFREILKSAGTNKLALTTSAFDYFKCAVTRGAQVWTFWGVRGAYNESLNKGKSTGDFTVEMVDTASANPTYV